MSDTSVPRGTLRVTTCDTDETLAAASGLFNQYRHHYGEPPDGDERTLAMGRFWQLRDLYVLAGSRRQGTAAALVTAVGEAALAAGATRLSLVTEPDNQAAIGLYRRLGFRPVEGLTSPSLELSPQAIKE
jgi:ribosomal protein S18 acetylase RimI-like enzyme